jgi:N-acetyl-anhydromuramyl-L-alanine amidase AmpD
VDKGLATVEQILPIYAPSFENNTQEYISQVEQWVADWQEEGTSVVQINDVGMTRAHHGGATNTCRMVVVHSTAGAYPGDYNWIRQGGSTSAPISCQYYIQKDGTITRFLADNIVAWHAGVSSWMVDGMLTHNLNLHSIGIELENRNNGHDPYPQTQLDACVQLTQHLCEEHNIPRGQVVRHADIAPGRKNDPLGFPWEVFVNAVFGEPMPEPEEFVAGWYYVTNTGIATERTDPDTSKANIVGELASGSRVHILRWEDDTNGIGGRWAQRSEAGTWVHQTGLELKRGES